MTQSCLPVHMGARLVEPIAKSVWQGSPLSVLGMWRHPHPAHPLHGGGRHFIAAVQELSCGPEMPHLTEALHHKYLGDIRSVGLTGEPKAVLRLTGDRRLELACTLLRVRYELR
jgi:hypothetical protein